MGSPLTPCLPQSQGAACGAAPVSPSLGTRQECLEQILQAFFDIADRDDIHQAAARLGFVQQWIAGEATRAAADPVFAALGLRGMSRPRIRAKSRPSLAS